MVYQINWEVEERVLREEYQSLQDNLDKWFEEATEGLVPREGGRYSYYFTSWKEQDRQLQERFNRSFVRLYEERYIDIFEEDRNNSDDSKAVEIFGIGAPPVEIATNSSTEPPILQLSPKLPSHSAYPTPDNIKGGRTNVPESNDVEIFQFGPPPVEISPFPLQDPLISAQLCVQPCEATLEGPPPSPRTQALPQDRWDPPSTFLGVIDPEDSESGLSSYRGGPAAEILRFSYVFHYFSSVFLRIDIGYPVLYTRVSFFGILRARFCWDPGGIELEKGGEREGRRLFSKRKSIWPGIPQGKLSILSLKILLDPTIPILQPDSDSEQYP